MLVPMVFALNDRNPNHRVVNLAERLIEPRMLARVSDRLNVDEFKRRELHVEPCVVREYIGIAHI